MRLVICDGNRILSEALAAALETQDNAMTAVATSTADDCISAVTDDKPNVCVLEPHLPAVEDGLQLVREIRDRCPGTAVLVLSDLTDQAIWAQASQLGIAGFLAKDRSVSQIADALQVIAAGEAAAFDRAPPNGASRPAAPFVLTPREEEVLRRIAAGQHTRQMAGEMDIAISTLRTYVKNVFAKLGVHSRLEAAAVASRANLVGEIPDQQLSRQDRQTVLHPT